MAYLSKEVLLKFEEYCRKHGIEGKKKEELLEKLNHLIVKYLYEPGEAIGVVAAQSISEPATQMSIDAKEKIIIKHKDRVAISEISRFTDESIENLGSMNENGWDICDLSGMEIYVPSINQGEKIEWKKVLACSRHKSPERLLRIRTLSGREIIATDSHSFVIRKHNKIVAVSGKDLRKGERIPVIKLLPENCIDSINLKSIAETHFSRAKKPLPEIFPLNEVTGYIFGAYLSEGNCTPNFVCISSTNEIFLGRIRQFASSFGLTYNEYDNTRGFANGHDIHVNSAILSALLAKTCGSGSRNKRVPDFAYSADEKFVSALLQAYFDGDGNVSVERGVIRASSNSKELIDGISLLLARFGIFSYKGRGKQYTLTIPAKYASVFRQKIGFSSAKKAENLGVLCASKPIKQDFVELVGGFDDLLPKLAKKLSYPSRYVNSFTKRQKIGKEALLRYIVLFNEIAKKNHIDVTEELSILRKMHASDVVWDEITEITEVLPSSGYVYDLTVEGTETFTTFEGIITHNTMRSYTLASQSDRLSKVTQGLPRLIEIFDARKTFEKNMIIYLKEEYNSKEKAKEIANRMKSVKVQDVILSDSIDLIDMQIELELEGEKHKEQLKSMVSKYVKEAAISFRGGNVYIKPKESDVKNLRKIKNKVLKMHIDGIKGIENVVVVREGDDWVIQTAGTNLKKVLQINEVDAKRTRTNDVHQIFEILGIEATRNVILQEAKETLDEQGLEVDVRHLMLLADIMTFTGEVRDIGRYGVSGKKASVLARANFEETKRHLINASFYGEKDTMDGIIENVLVGQLAPIGTGMVELTMDLSKMKKKK
ncbi:MAG: DNA-directed RNA polymerase subunit A'' [Candidatus Aenigmarchaeota archaeon]|nr:DNA-directed RNA polymerase subunit A'' [Candidatus Aenigmarchaeota archaeon]